MEEDAAGPRSRNAVLASLREQDLLALRPFLHPVSLRQNEVCLEADVPVEHLIFVEAGVVSLVAGDGAGVEIGVVGREGLIGGSALLGGAPPLHRAIVQVPGQGLRMAARAARAAAELSPDFRDRILVQTQLTLATTARSAFCNSQHRLPERCARWLLLCLDRVDGDGFPLTHDYLSRMLGVSRPNVTVAVNVLQAEGLIRYTRGHVAVLDRAGLERASCNCYRVMHDYAGRLLPSPAREG